MNIQVMESATAVTAIAAAEIIRAVKRNPFLRLGLPTGRTPLPMYQALITAYQNGDISFADVQIFNVDEYLGIGRNHHASFANYMRRNLFDHIDSKPNNTFIPNGLAADYSVEAARYESLIDKSGGLDMLVLGLGANGHVGFNEPGSSIETATHLVELSQNTLNANQQDLDGTQVEAAITMGLGTILRAHRILLLATGQRKAEAVRQMQMDGDIANWPARALRGHPNLTVYCDKDVAG